VARAIAKALDAIAIAILINLVTTPPLPGWLGWLKPGRPQVIALVVLVAASVLIEVLARRTDKTDGTGMRVKTKPKLQPRYDEKSAQYRNPMPLTNIFEHRVGLLNASDAEPLTHVGVHLVDMSPLPRHRRA
jgi:hypothetical protein